MVRITLDSGLSITYEKFYSLSLIIENEIFYYNISGTLKPNQFIPDEVHNNVFPDNGPNKIRTIEFLP